MKHIAFAALLICGYAQAQTVPGQVTLNWELPTQTVTGLPLAGADALTELRIYIDTKPITMIGAPTLSLGPGQTAATHTVQVANGSTLYARMQACNGPATARKCSSASNEVSKLVQIDTTPAMPVNVTITLEIG